MSEETVVLIVASLALVLGVGVVALVAWAIFGWWKAR